jgi:hypothetical protein
MSGCNLDSRVWFLSLPLCLGISPHLQSIIPEKNEGKDNFEAKITLLTFLSGQKTSQILYLGEKYIYSFFSRNNTGLLALLRVVTQPKCLNSNDK